MGWSLDWRLSVLDPEAVDCAMLAAGKALYLANEFEAKCSYVLRIANLAAWVEGNPEAHLADALAAVAQDKLLNPTLQALASILETREEEVALLNRARQARNFIAHHGGQVGFVPSVDQRRVDEYLDRLRAAVRDLVDGDNVISRWVYEVEEKQTAPASMVAAYPSLAERWIFGDRYATNP